MYQTFTGLKNCATFDSFVFSLFEKVKNTPKNGTAAAITTPINILTTFQMSNCGVAADGTVTSTANIPFNPAFPVNATCINPQYHPPKKAPKHPHRKYFLFLKLTPNIAGSEIPKKQTPADDKAIALSFLSFVLKPTASAAPACEILKTTSAGHVLSNPSFSKF